MINKNLKLKSGQSLVELMIAIALAALLLPALFTGMISSREGEAQQNTRNAAVALLKETSEALRNIREKNWNTFAVNGTYYPHIAADNSWELITTSTGENLNGLLRKVTISNSYRDSTGKIVETPGILDPSTKKININISWSMPRITSIDSVYYMTRYLDNASNVWTTTTDFNNGIKTGVAVNTTAGGVPNDGEVILGAGGSGDWCGPSPSYNATLDLPKNGVANAISAIQGRIFAGTGDNASGVSFANVNVTNTTPPVASIIGTIDGYKTNAFFCDQNFVFIATDTNSKEIVIIDISHTPYTEVGYFNAPGNGQGDSVFVSGNTGYMISANKLYNFDLSGKTGSRPIIDATGVELGGSGSKIVIVGNYAYVSLKGSAKKMQIIDLSNPTNLNVVGSATFSSGDATDIFVNVTGTRAYLAAAASIGPEFFIVDVSSKTGERSFIGSYDTNGMDTKGVTVVSGNRAIVVGHNGEEYQVINISNESSPSRCGGLNIDTGVNGIASVMEADGDAYSYIITGDASSELKIIEGGPGGLFSSSGTYESSIFAPSGGYDRAFNRFDVTINRLSSTDIYFQVAVSNPADGNCNTANYTYVGPGGDPSTFFTTDITTGAKIYHYPIPFGSYGASFVNPGKCFKYKTYFSTTDSTQSPILYDFTVNYSP